MMRIQRELFDANNLSEMFLHNKQVLGRSHLDDADDDRWFCMGWIPSGAFLEDNQNFREVNTQIWKGIDMERIGKNQNMESFLCVL